jgi:nitrogen fixation NifU-like protein
MAAPYDDVILDHIRNARNYHVPAAANRQVAGSNPLCGDELVLYLEFDGNRIADIGYQCACCGLSMASASVMTERVKGRSTAEAELLVQRFAGNLAGTLQSDPVELVRGQRALLDAAARFPGRAQCLALPWKTLMTALAATGPG